MSQKDHSMIKIAVRWVLPTSALLLFGPLAAWPVAALRSAEGGPDATLLLSSAPALGVLALALLAVLAGVGGGLTARVTAAGTGRTFAGLCVVWSAMRTGDSWRILTDLGSGAVIPLAVEGALVAIAGAGVLVALLALGGGQSPRAAVTELLGAVRGKSAPIGLAIGVAAGLLGAGLVALDGARGQGLLGGVGAGVLCAVGVQMASPELSAEQARLRASIAMLALMVVAPLTMLITPGAGAIADAARAGSLTGPGIVQPLDLLAGILLGVPTGMAWVGSVSERAAAKAKQPA